MVRAGLKSMLCTGTCFEYGMVAGELFESFKADPRNPYGFAKDALRQQLAHLRSQVPFGLTWARLFYMYGEGQPASSLYTQFMAAGSRGDAAFRMSAGEQLRDFLPVRVVAKHLVDLALGVEDAGVVNVCSGRPTSVRRLVESWRAERGWDIELALGHFPYPDYEPMAFWGSAARLQGLLGPCS
jgi:dTDP-6-deoxy-L-talose 4-dehydrogenase (NAD+)